MIERLIIPCRDHGCNRIAYLNRINERWYHIGCTCGQSGWTETNNTNKAIEEALIAWYLEDGLGLVIVTEECPL
jgi:hypothetical protein